ncbi:hypothetical protein DFH09DRAFT_1069372 [Mycena vulgaris]|nr:hypothetical protein DFH09DRAFT_1069372 [Mycena vulgaris]
MDYGLVLELALRLSPQATTTLTITMTQTRNGACCHLLAHGPVNTTGLAFLPVETLHEITSQLRGVPLSKFRVLPSIYLEHFDALCSLSEPCQRLRAVFLVPAWERTEVCASAKVLERPNGHEYNGSIYPVEGRGLFESSELATDFSRELGWQMEVVSKRNPTLASAVRFVPSSSKSSQILTDRVPEVTVSKFMKYLGTIPNLKTLQIFAIGDPIDAIIKALRPLTFNAVHTLTLPPTMVPLAQQFPNLRSFTTSPLFCTHALNCFLNAKPTTDVANSLSHLVQIPSNSIYVDGLTPEIVRLLKCMPNLRQINLIDYHYHFGTHTHTELVNTAQEVLRKSRAAQKCVTVEYRSFGELRRHPIN